MESKLCHWLRQKPHIEFFPYYDDISLSDVGFLLQFIYCDLSFLNAWNLALDDKIWIKIVSFGFNQDITDFSWYWLTYADFFWFYLKQKLFLWALTVTDKTNSLSY